MRIVLFLHGSVPLILYKFSNSLRFSMTSVYTSRAEMPKKKEVGDFLCVKLCTKTQWNIHGFACCTWKTLKKPDADLPWCFHCDCYICGSRNLLCFEVQSWPSTPTRSASPQHGASTVCQQSNGRQTKQRRGKGTGIYTNHAETNGCWPRGLQIRPWWLRWWWILLQREVARADASSRHNSALGWQRNDTGFGCGQAGMAAAASPARSDKTNLWCLKNRMPDHLLLPLE